MMRNATINRIDIHACFQKRKTKSLRSSTFNTIKILGMPGPSGLCCHGRDVKINGDVYDIDGRWQWRLADWSRVRSLVRTYVNVWMNDWLTGVSSRVTAVCCGLLAGAAFEWYHERPSHGPVSRYYLYQIYFWTNYDYNFQCWPSLEANSWNSWRNIKDQIKKYWWKSCQKLSMTNLTPISIVWLVKKTF